MDYNIDTKLSTITLNNCSINDKLINKVKDKLHLKNLLRNETLLHIRFYAYILNLIVKDGLEIMKDGNLIIWKIKPKHIEKTLSDDDDWILVMKEELN